MMFLNIIFIAHKKLLILLYVIRIFSATPITIFPLTAIYNTAFWDFCGCQQALNGPNVSPQESLSTALPYGTTTKVDKDANFTILTFQIYSNVNELNAENWRAQKKIRETEKK